MSSPASYTIELSDNRSFEVTIGSDGSIGIDGAAISPDVVASGKNRWNLLLENQSYNIELISFDGDAKSLVLSVNGEEFQIAIKDELDLLLSKMGMSGGASSRMVDVKAPMPGLVLKVLVAAGQEVAAGDPLIILEAMKMENIIKATGAGVVGKVLVGNQDTVDKNQVLIEMQ